MEASLLISWLLRFKAEWDCICLYLSILLLSLTVGLNYKLRQEKCVANEIFLQNLASNFGLNQQINRPSLFTCLDEWSIWIKREAASEMKLVFHWPEGQTRRFAGGIFVLSDGSSLTCWSCWLIKRRRTLFLIHEFLQSSKTSCLLLVCCLICIFIFALVR